MRPTRRPLSLAIALSCAALLGSCSSSDDGAPGGSGGTGSGSTGRAGDRLASLELASALQPFDSCDDLLGYLKDEATDRVTAYGLPGVGGGGYRYASPMLESAAGAAPTTTAVAVNESAGGSVADKSAGAATDAYSQTNTVEKGIDEGDTVKTDGTHLFLIDSGSATLRIVAAGDGQPAEVGRLALPGYPAQLVRVGTTLLVTGSPDATLLGEGQGGTDQTGKSIAPVWTGERSAVWQVDVADPASPRVVRQLVLDGSVATIRMTGEVARIVVQSPPNDLGFVSPANPAGEARALATNKTVIAESTIDQWLGGYRLLDADGKELNAGRLTGCDGVGRPADFHGFTLTSVLNVDVTKGLSEPSSAAVLADSQQVYASAEHLYVAIGAWQDPMIADDVAVAQDGASSDGDPAEATTAIHQFRFDGARAVYTATGEVTGSLMNDFSMSEHDGVLRVATTEGLPWLWGNGPDSESFVTTLRADGAELRRVGRVGGLGRGERIYAVRFIGPNGYVVTFRQTDPLYVVDLSDPAAPAVTGELKINGYSAYLHPLSDGRLLGVGQDATDEGRVTGTQVSVFDVSDPAAPARTATFTMPQTTSAVEYDYKAFLYWEPEQLVLLPYNSYGMDGSADSGAVALHIGETISERGRITSTPVAQPCYPTPMPTILADGATTEQTTTTAPAPDAAAAGASSPGSPGFAPVPSCPTWAPPIERTVVIGRSIYAIAAGGVTAADLATLAPQGKLTFS